MFLQIKDIKHKECFFCSDAWIIPQGWDLGAPGCSEGQNVFFEHFHVAHLIEGDDKRNRIQEQFLPYGQIGDRWMMSKGQMSLNFKYKINFKDLCGFSQIKYIIHG